jgi:glycosyltransferase involved in cell wall biosynthesis
MTSPQPLVSIVTPSFNYASFLGACVESVRCQRYEHIEHIVQDGGSTDGTPALLARLAAEGPLDYRIERDAGQADAINRGFARARGDVLAWLNADDLYLGPDVVSEAVAALADPAVDVVTAGGRYVDASGSAFHDIEVFPDLERHLRYFDPVLQPATFWKRRVHRPVRTDVHYAFDWRLFLEMSSAGAQFRVLDRRWAAYRWHGVNKSAADPAARRLEIASVLRDEFGTASLQYAWARAVYLGYAASERLGIRALKTATALANNGMRILTRRRVWSC